MYILRRTLCTAAVQYDSLVVDWKREEKCFKFHRIISIHALRHSGTKETAPAGIFERHLDKGTRAGVYPRLSVMQGAVKYLGYADEHSPEPVEVMIIEAGQFGVFPPEKWHNIEVMTDDTYFNIDFFVAPEVLMESANQRKVVRTGKE
ncbi:tellurite resistance protein TehB [Citrobacter braakii]|nr:tellurite resistance protein TehB [Citrobacter braakii]